VTSLQVVKNVLVALRAATRILANAKLANKYRTRIILPENLLLLIISRKHEWRQRTRIKYGQYPTKHQANSHPLCVRQVASPATE